MATDILLPKEKDCLVCHDGRRARKECGICHDDPKTAGPFAPRTRTFRFPHKLHVGLGDLGPVIAAAVANKQYYSQPPPRAADLKTGNACAGCHRGVARVDLAGNPHLPQMADCIVCHSNVDPPFSCDFCHIQEAKLKPASHTPDYLEFHARRGVKLDKPSCTICHGVNFRCLGCH